MKDMIKLTGKLGFSHIGAAVLSGLPLGILAYLIPEQQELVISAGAYLYALLVHNRVASFLLKLIER